MDEILHQLETMETILCWYLQGNHHSMVSCVVQDFVHPQYEHDLFQCFSQGASRLVLIMLALVAIFSLFFNVGWLWMNNVRMWVPGLRGRGFPFDTNVDFAFIPLLFSGVVTL